ncbi:MAG: polymer-forming cytoskeletal protein [Alphaproteobacteria bacterium]|nr:polymer-forming cytoskeletal protein [Alphaproteobacteria bacterium]
MPNAHAERSTPTVVSAGMHISGNLVSDGDVQIDGCVEGDVQSPKCIISENGSVLGSVFADEVAIRGSVSGHVYARIVTLKDTARVALDITYGEVIVEPGAAIEGRLKPVSSGDELLSVRPSSRLLPGSSLHAIPGHTPGRQLDPVWAMRPAGEPRPGPRSDSSLWPDSGSLTAFQSDTNREGLRSPRVEIELSAGSASETETPSAATRFKDREQTRTRDASLARPSPETALGFEIEAEPIWDAEPEVGTIFVSTTAPQQDRAATLYPLGEPTRAEQEHADPKRVQIPITLQTRGSKPRRSRTGVLTLVALAVVAGGGLYLGSRGLFQDGGQYVAETPDEATPETVSAGRPDVDVGEKEDSLQLAGDPDQHASRASDVAATQELVDNTKENAPSQSETGSRSGSLPNSTKANRGVESDQSVPAGSSTAGATGSSRITAATNAGGVPNDQRARTSIDQEVSGQADLPTAAPVDRSTQTAALDTSARAIDDFKAGMDASQRDEFELAIERFSPAIASGKLSPENLAAAYRNRARAYSGKGDYRRAVADYSETIKLLPLDPVAHNNRGFAYNKMGLPAKALEDINKAIDLSPSYSYAYSNRCWAYRNLGERAKAIADCQKALSLNSRLTFARKTLKQLGAEP